MKIQTINHIETSSMCDRSCRYCPAKDQGQHRPTGLMDMETFDKVMEWVYFFTRRGTQTELNLHGVGEPTLNPLLPEMIEKARRHVPLRFGVHINTNGQWVDISTPLITEAEIDYANELKLAGISHVDLTGHDPFRTAKAVRIFQSVGISGNISLDFVTNPNTWAGQVDWFSPMYNAGPCPWIKKGQAFIMSNGDVARCTIDAFGTGILGNVATDALDQIELAPFELCERCHHSTENHP